MFYPVKRWLSGPRWVRWSSLLGIVSAVSILIDTLSLQPLRTLMREYSSKNQQESEAVAKLRREVISLISFIRNDDIRLTDSQPQRFSVMELVHKSGGKLEKWQPESKPATLEMVLDWETLPAIFVHFSHYGNLGLQAFSMAPQGEKLKLIVALDITDES